MIRDLDDWPAEGWNPREPAPVPRGLDVLRGVPINQEDLLGVLGTFTIAVIDGVEKLGVGWDRDSQQAYIELWDRVGALLGIGGESRHRLLKSDFEIDVPPESKGASARRPSTSSASWWT